VPETEIVGGVVFTGGSGITTAVGAEAAMTGVVVAFAISCTTIVCPASALVST